MDQKQVEKLTIKSVRHICLKHGDCSPEPSLEQVKAMLAMEGDPVPHLTEDSWLFKHCSLYWAAARDQYHKRKAATGAVPESDSEIGKLLDQIEIDEINMSVDQLTKQLGLNPKQVQRLQQMSKPTLAGDIVKGAALTAGAAGIGALLGKAAATMTPEQKQKAIAMLKSGGQAVQSGASAFMNSDALRSAVEQVKTHGKDALRRMEPGLRAAVINIIHGKHPAEGTQPVSGIAGVPESASPAAQLLWNIDELTPMETQRLSQFVAQHPGNQPGSGNTMATGTGAAPGAIAPAPAPAAGTSYAQGQWHQELGASQMASNVQSPGEAPPAQGSEVGQLLNGAQTDPLDKLADAVQPQLQGSEQTPNDGVDTLMREKPNPALPPDDGGKSPWGHGE